jgi:hypothetical protein
MSRVADRVHLLLLEVVSWRKDALPALSDPPRDRLAHALVAPQQPIHSFRGEAALRASSSPSIQCGRMAQNPCGPPPPRRSCAQSPPWSTFSPQRQSASVLTTSRKNRFIGLSHRSERRSTRAARPRSVRGRTPEFPRHASIESRSLRSKATAERGRLETLQPLSS